MFSLKVRPELNQELPDDDDEL